MGFLDKVKATAEKAAEKAQQGVQQGQQKLEDIQEKRKLDGLLHDLGAAVFLDRTGRGTAAISTDIERLTAEIREVEQEGAEIPVPKGAAPPGTVGSSGDPSPTPPMPPTPPPAGEG